MGRVSVNFRIQKERWGPAAVLGLDAAGGSDRGYVTQGFAATLCPPEWSQDGELAQPGSQELLKRGPEVRPPGSGGAGGWSRRMRCHGDACDVTPVGPRDLPSPTQWMVTLGPEMDMPFRKVGLQ